VSWSGWQGGLCIIFGFFAIMALATIAFEWWDRYQERKLFRINPMFREDWKDYSVGRDVK